MGPGGTGRPADRAGRSAGERGSYQAGSDRSVTRRGGIGRHTAPEDGLAERLMAEGGLIDMPGCPQRPLEQIAFVAETSNRLAPNLEACRRPIDMLRDAVIAEQR